MRTTSLLVLLIGAVACEPFFQSGREHEFQYRGKMLTGIPELDSQYSGLTIESKVILQSLGSQEYKLAMKNIRYSKFNERLSEDRSENWRQLEVPEASPVPSEHQTYLQYPIEFSMQDGEIKDIKVSDEEPEWATNLKKSLVSLIKVQLPSQHDQKSNTVRGSNSFPKIWEVMEQGVDGKCENTYQVNEIPESELQELVEAKYISRERCLNKKIYQVMKTRNVNKCSERTSYQVNQPGKTLCPTGNCDNMWQRTSMTRYFGCGSSEENMELEVIVNEAELQQNLRAYKTETIVTGVRQMLKVEEVRTELTSLPKIPSPRTIEGLYYEYPLPKGERSTSYRDQQKKLRDMPVTSDFLSALRNKDEHSILSKLSPTTLKQRIVKQLEKITEDLEEVEEFGKKQVAANVMAASKVFSLLSTEDMKSLYEEIKEHKSTEEKREQMKQLLQEIAVITGTSPAVVFTRHLIESREMGIVRSAMAIATLPHYVRTPTIKLINEVFELVKSPVVQENESVKMNAMLAFGTIVNRACLDSNRFERFPVFVYGEFCNSKNTEITKEYIPFLVNQLESARNQGEKAAAIVALGNLGHESALQILMPYIEGRDQVTPFEQRMAIYSIHNFDEDRRHEVMKIYSSLVFNPSEERDTRIAALSMMLNLEPSTVVFQKLATSTWFEQDTEFHKFVYATLKSLSKIEETEQPNAHTMLYRNSHKAKQVIDMAKPVPTVFSYALNHFAAEYLKNLEVGYHVHYAHTITERMQHFYGKIEYFLQQLKFTPIEFCAHMTGKELTREVSKLFYSQDKQSSSEWEEIVSKLSIQEQDKEDTPFHAGIWARLFDDIQVMYGIEPHHIEPTIEKIKMAIREPKSMKSELCGKTPFNFVKVSNYAPTEIVIPSDMGFPIIIELHMPSVVAIEGELEVECSGVTPTVSLEVTNKGSSSLSGYVGTICPFTMDVIATGVEEQYAFNYPVKMTTHVKNGKVNMVFSHMKNVKSSTQEIDIMYYNVRPFSTIKPIVFIDGLPLVQHKDTKTLKSEDELKSVTLPYGESIGLDLKLKMRTETNVLGAQGLLEYSSLYNYNPVNMALFSWTSSAMSKTGRASCREHEVKFVYNPSRSQTDEIEIDLDFNLALKSKKSEPKIVKIKSQQQQQQQHQHQQQRQQNQQQQNQQQQQQQQQQRQQQQPLIQIQQEQMDASRPEHQKIQQILKKSDIEEGFGLTTKLEINFRGGAPKTYSYSLSAAHGFRNLKQKWNLHLESPHTMDICVEGEATMPKVSLREEQSSKLEVFYKNTLGFGKTCEEHKIEVTGTTGVSRDQVEKSRSSEESRECRELTRKVSELRDEIRSKVEESSEYKRIRSELVQVHEKKQESCEERRDQERTLDEVKFEITHTPMPEYVRQYARYMDFVVKGALAPYMTKYESTHSENKIEVELTFERKSHSFDMVLTTENEEIKYKDIRMPEYLREIIPMEASYDSIREISSSIKGSNLYPRCRVGESIVQSFDKKSFHYELDDCYHVLSAETEQDHEYAVLAKEQDGKKELKIFVSGSKITIRPTESKEEYEIEFDGERIEMEKNEKKELRTRGQGHSCKLWRSNDDVLVIETPFSRVIYDAKTVEIENTRLTSTELKGLCGNSNQDKRDETISAQGCIAKSAETAALTFRVQEKSCSALSQQKKIKQQQQKQQQCKKVKSQQQQQKKTVKLAQLAQKESEECNQMKHALVRQGKTLCISQVPIVECGNGCEARNNREKVVPFTCLPANRPRVAKLYEEKVRRGEILPELRNMDQAFQSEMQVPSSCAHPGL